jgi:GNAT superfamily N-acetyltransferase
MGSGRSGGRSGTATPPNRRPESRVRVETESLSIRVAEPDEVGDVCSILLEAARWLDERGTPMWRPEFLGPDRVAPDVAAGLFVLARWGEEPAGTFKFQLSDPEFWPELATDESAFVHRLAVRRKYSDRGVSTALLEWAADRGRSLGRAYLRLDCDARRPRLRALYERHGFVHHSDFRVMGEAGQLFDCARYEFRL